MYNNQYNNNMTEKDYDFIIQNYKTKSQEEMASILNKSKNTIVKAMRKKNLKKNNTWTQEEIEYIKNNYKIKTYAEIGKTLNRPENTIQNKAISLGLKKSETTINWTQEELTYLENNINSKSYEEIANNINRTMSSIYNKVWELGLVPPELKNARKLKREQMLFIISNFDKYTDSEFAKKFNCSISAVEDLRKKYGIIKTGNEVKKSSIEIYIKELLDKNDIEYVYNEYLGRYKPDFQIKNTKILIEVQGDYYHCNPNIYKDGPKDEIQIRHVLNDYYKKCYYNEYEIIEIWEKDILNNPIKVEKIIEEIKTAVYGQVSQKAIED